MQYAAGKLSLEHNELPGQCHLFPLRIQAVKDRATVQEICDVYREVFGEYRDPGLY